MKTPARNSLAIIGAGPIGLEAAAAALESGFDVHVFERGEVGAHALAWGHVQMFTPWSANIGPASERLLKRNGWTPPNPVARPTGTELAEALLAPLANTPELRDRVHAHSQVVHIARHGALKGDGPDATERRNRPFRLLVRDSGGRENMLHAFAVIDASGVYGSPNCAGTGGIPARGETYLAPQMCYRCDDVAGLRRAKHSGRRTLVIGGGATAATTVAALAGLAAEAEGTSVVWATRRSGGALAGERPGDPLPARAALFTASHALQRGENPAVTWIGGAEVEGFEYNSGTHRYRVALSIGEANRVEEVDEVVVNAGFGPNTSLYRELQVSECPVTRASAGVAEALRSGAGADSADTLAHPEPDFYILGAKAYGRNNTFLLANGYAQVAGVVAKLARDLSVPAGS